MEKHGFPLLQLRISIYDPSERERVEKHRPCLKDRLHMRPEERLEAVQEISGQKSRVQVTISGQLIVPWTYELLICLITSITSYCLTTRGKVRVPFL